MTAVIGPALDTPRSSKSPTLPNTLTNVTAFARFEFEPGKGNDGTKILMVEWQDEEKNRSPGTWKVLWSGKTTLLSADEPTSDNTRRLYFLLPPGTTVPPHVTLLYQPVVDARSSSAQTPPQALKVCPLPAIFTPELGVTAKASGKKGVLHTIWAKKRLQVLEDEIKREEEFNLEGIALEMALAEKDWIVSNFGLSQQKPPTLDLGAVSKYAGWQSLQSPRSPGGRRLSDKLKGLTIATSERELGFRVNTPIHETHPLSPEGSDVAYSSFKSFRNGPASPRPGNVKKVTSFEPPDNIRDLQVDSPNSTMTYVSPDAVDDTTDDLFAKALSPRTPDLPKSPFSITTAEVAPFATFKGDHF